MHRILPLYPGMLEAELATSKVITISRNSRNSAAPTCQILAGIAVHPIGAPIARVSA
jgi:hypothetical protein